MREERAGEGHYALLVQPVHQPLQFVRQRRAPPQLRDVRALVLLSGGAVAAEGGVRGADLIRLRRAVALCLLELLL